MVERQFTEALAAVLARLIIAQHDVGARWAQCHPWHAHIRQQLHDDRLVQGETPGVYAFLDCLADVVIYKGDLLLGEQHDEPTLWDDRERLERRIEHKHWHWRPPSTLRHVAVPSWRRRETNVRQAGALWAAISAVYDADH